MGQFTSLGTTFDLPNYAGMVHSVSPTDAVLFSMIGGVNGGKGVATKLWEWQSYDLKTAGFGTRKVEGAAPDYNGRTRSHISNVTMIFQYGVELSYTALGNTALMASHAGGFTTDADQSVGAVGGNPVTDEMAWQMQRKLEEAAVDMNYELWNSTFTNPATNASGRSTRGLLEAITTNHIALDSGAGSPADLDGTPAADTTIGAPSVGSTYIDHLLKDMFDNASIRGELVLFCNSSQKGRITQAYTQSGALAPRDRTVGGVAVETLVLDFATISVVLDRHLPQSVIVVANVSQLVPVWTTIPGKGHFFSEPKPSDGSSLKMMLYGELGLEYGLEKYHGKITNLAV